jgi:hypothetical protein
VALTATGVERGVFAFVAGGLGAALWFYSRFPIPAGSYMWPHAQVFLIYVASHALGYWALAVFDRGLVGGLDQALTLGWSACLAAWLWVFSKPFAYPPAATQSELETANRLARQLERAVNQ